MNQDIEKILFDIGLNDREVKVYLATLELGESTVLPIAKKADIKRTYCYDILADLAKKDLVSYYEKNGRRRYVATDPKAIKQLIRDRLSHFETILPALSALYKPNKEKPSVRFYEGSEEIKKIYDEVKEANEIWVYGGFEMICQYFQEFDEFIIGRLKSKAMIRELTPKTSKTMEVQKLYQSYGKEMSFLPAGMNFETDNIIYDDKVAMISYGETIHGLVVESKAIVNTQKVLYEQLWKISSAQ